MSVHAFLRTAVHYVRGTKARNTRHISCGVKVIRVNAEPARVARRRRHGNRPTPPTYPGSQSITANAI
ncbi:unnamed protein product [Leptosia nina]|uniref:Uncharacterized protein n=1 Tax=Leptosia nina TaxID=320188 RepID=A0AAV1J7G9_9NEOP